eukprot:CAMPEP_0198148634 /NCGR_PEP_ID=MMETSP1443-20131203/42416_1 /TAXON_ID=186043 /ORGANISM="Entomoneis sp., Strain CCMP2396" /LENGTH=360 /DNA_ID=CAMNT_0043813361 /DNA_START=52 /DNA_END=1131 /DNA_ORIENTATION=+
MGNAPSIDLSQGLPHTEKKTERGVSSDQKLQYAVSGMRGFRQYMEDEHLACMNLPVEGQPIDCLSDHSLFAVFDGHGGKYASKYCSANFLGILSKRTEISTYAQLSKIGPKSRCDTNGISLLKHALGNSFLQLDQELLTIQRQINSDQRQEREESAQAKADFTGVPQPVLLAERSGSTCVVVLITPSHIICANAGDSRAILRRNGRAIPLSFDHKPSDIPEKLRIMEAGGEVKSKRVDGDLAVSRAMGDHIYKANMEKKALQQKVIAAPDLTVYPRNHIGDEFIVIACDGVWDVATNSQCSEFIQSLLSHGETDLASMCEESIDTCLERNSRDNITLLMVGLPGLKVDTTKGALVTNALW